MFSKIIYKVFSKLFLILLIVIIFQSLILNISSSFAAVAPAPIEWNKTYGGTGDDVATCMIKTNDGGYAIAGSTTSYGAGGSDFWLIKIDSSGDLLWDKTYGGTSNDNATSIIQTNDGGYALVGLNGWLLKLDSSGNIQWNQTVRESTSSVAANCHSIVQTNDGGYAIMGVAPYLGGIPILVKFDSLGNLQWSKRFGSGSPQQSPDFGPIIHTNDDGLGLIGTVYSGPDWRFNALFFNKLDSTGTTTWSIDWGYNNAYGYAAVQTNDDGYILLGRAGNYLCLIKLDSTGNRVWNTTCGSSRSANYLPDSSIIQTSDGGYAFATATSSAFQVPNDFLLVKTDSAGNLLWNKTFGGAGSDNVCSVVETNDGGFLLAGSTTSFGAGGSDFWVVKVPPNSQISSNDNYDGLWHTTNVPITLTNNNPTNTQNIYYRINEGLAKTINVDGQPIITSEAANNSLEYWSTDKSGLEEWPHKLITIKIDKTAPTGSIIINNGNISTNSRSVTLTLTYMDATSNVSQVRYSNDNVWDTEQWETPTLTKAWSLTLGDETKTVYYQIKDNAGLVSQTYSDSIDLRMKDKPSSLSLILDSETSLIGFKVNLNGKLTSNGIPITNASILLSYSVTGGQTWNDIATVSTINDGTYSTIWQPSATSTYLVKASFTPYFTYNNTEIIRMLSVNSFDGQNVFSVTSNSSVSALAFNSTSRELSFTVSGETGTVGFVDLSIAKSLISNIVDVKVSLDGKTLNYTVTSTSNAWLLHFTYTHSVHNVNVELGTVVIPEILPSWMIIALLIMILASIKLSKQKLYKPET